jgi:periplasmic divalent cation tolerance protein
MAHSPEYRVVLSTCPDRAVAEDIAGRLVAGRLAACVNILPGVRSIYEWQGKVENEAEVLMVIKTTADRYPELEAAIGEHHPYDVPEVLALDVSAGLPDYLQWMDQLLRER